MERQAVLGCSLLLCFLLTFTAPFPAVAASLRRVTTRHVVRPVARHVRPIAHPVRYRFISCVPYARERSGISLPGNAWQWWGNAAGHYARGQAPAAGAVLTFRPIARMPLGHVAVVSRVVNAREILVDQANWMPAGVVRLGVPVIDVSPENNWTEVRVSTGYGHQFGTVYPTYGFIYKAPPGAVRTEVARRLPEPPLPPSSLHGTRGPIEIAEAPAPVLGSPLSHGSFRLDGPDRSLR